MDFMDKFAQKFSKGTKALSEKTEELFEITELKMNIKNIEEDIEEAKLYIGEVVYKYFKSNNIPLDEVKEKCREIEKMYYEINNLKEKINYIRGTEYCKGCGYMLDDDEIYCPKCGHRVR